MSGQNPDPRENERHVLAAPDNNDNPDNNDHHENNNDDPYNDDNPDNIYIEDSLEEVRFHGQQHQGEQDDLHFLQEVLHDSFEEEEEEEQEEEDDVSYAQYESEFQPEIEDEDEEYYSAMVKNNPKIIKYFYLNIFFIYLYRKTMLMMMTRMT